MHATSNRFLLAATIAVATLVVAASADAGELTAVRIGTHPTYTRVVFELDAPGGYSIARQLADDGVPEMLVTMDASSGPRSLDSGSLMVERVAVQDGAERAVAHIRLRRKPSRVKETILTSPPRLVFDFVYPEEVLSARKAESEKRAVKPAAAPTPIAAAEAPKPAPDEAPEAQPRSEPKQTAAAPKPVPAPERAAPPAPKPAATRTAEVKPALPAPTPATLAKPETAAPAPGLAPAAEPPETAKQGEATRAPEPATAAAKTDAQAAADAPAAKPESAASAAGDIPEPQVVAQAPVPAPKPRPPAPERKASPSLPAAPAAPAAERSGSGMDWKLVGGVGAGVLALAIGLLLWSRRRSLPNDIDITAFAEDASGDDDSGFAMGLDASDDAESSFDLPQPAGSTAPQASTEIASGPGLFDDDSDKEKSAMDLENPDLPMDRTASEMPTQMGPMAGAAGGDTLRMLRDLESRLVKLETRLDEANDARERLERQVTAQAEELRVQRAAIARTQRALRGMNRGEEDQATEPAIREPNS